MSFITWTIRCTPATPGHFACTQTTGVSYSIDSDGSALLTFSSPDDAEKFLAAIRAACTSLGGDDVV